MSLNFDFGDDNIGKPDTANRKGRNETNAQVVNQTPFDQDERFSLVKAELSFVAIKNKLADMDKKAKALEVKDDNTNATAMEMLVQCRALIKATNKAKTGIPAYSAAAKFKSGVDTFIRDQLRKPIEKIERLINPKVGSYQKAQAELRRRIEQKKADEERERIAKETKEAEEKAEKAHAKKLKEDAELQERLNKEADDAGVERVKVDTPELVVPETIIPSTVTPIIKKTEKISTKQGTSVIKARWICKVNEPDKVPREHCVPDQKSLDVAVEAGAREIPGCYIYEKFEAKVRISSKRPSFSGGNIFGSDADNESF